MNTYRLRPYTTVSLSQTPLWRSLPETLSHDKQVQLTYERCRSLIQHYSAFILLIPLCSVQDDRNVELRIDAEMTKEDILSWNTKAWAIQYALAMIHSGFLLEMEEADMGCLFILHSSDPIMALVSLCVSPHDHTEIGLSCRTSGRFGRNVHEYPLDPVRWNFGSAWRRQRRH